MPIVLRAMESGLDALCSAWRTSYQVTYATQLTDIPKRRLRGRKGYPGCEFQIREALAEVIGKEKSEYFFDKVRSPVSPTIAMLIDTDGAVPRTFLC